MSEKQVKADVLYQLAEEFHPEIMSELKDIVNRASEYTLKLRYLDIENDELVGTMKYFTQDQYDEALNEEENRLLKERSKVKAVISGSLLDWLKNNSFSIDRLNKLDLRRLDECTGRPLIKLKKTLLGTIGKYYIMTDRIDFRRIDGGSISEGFDYIDIELRVLGASTKESALDFMKKYHKEVSMYVFTEAESRPNVKNLGIPINFFKISDAIVMSDGIVRYILELKTLENDVN